MLSLLGSHLMKLLLAFSSAGFLMSYTYIYSLPFYMYHVELLEKCVTVRPYKRQSPNL